MTFTRRDQLEKSLVREIAEILPGSFPIKKFGMVSVLWVKVAKGFDSAKVGMSVFRNSHQFDEVARKTVAKIQAALNKKLVMKKVPKIILELDRSGEILEKLENL
ncbi:MAG: ribosome-binding factor A [Patescibacteria group bacterium]